MKIILGGAMGRLCREIAAEAVSHGDEIVYGMDDMGPVTKKLYDTLRGIQMGEIEAPEGWVVTIQ